MINKITPGFKGLRVKDEKTVNNLSKTIDSLEGVYNLSEFLKSADKISGNRDTITLSVNMSEKSPLGLEYKIVGSDNRPLVKAFIQDGTSAQHLKPLYDDILEHLDRALNKKDKAKIDTIG